jgi:hypothetical protein
MKAFALGILLALFAQGGAAQTSTQAAQTSAPSEKDLTDTLDYSLWLLRLQYWIGHPGSGEGEEIFKKLNLSPADAAALRTVAAEYNERHEQLMAEHYGKIDNNQWTPETETQLIENLILVTKDAIRRIQSDLTEDGAKRVDNLVLRNDQDSVFER